MASPEAVDAPRRALISEVVALQRGLEEINSKITSTHAENAALTRENATLSEYIDSLMGNVAAMGAKITADKTSLRSSLLGGQRARVNNHQVNSHLGELHTKPVARRSGSLSPMRHRSGSCGCSGSATAAPMRSPGPSPAPVPLAHGGGESSPLRLATPLATPPSLTQPSRSVPPPPPPPPPAVARDPATGRYGVGQAPPPPPPRPPG